MKEKITFEELMKQAAGQVLDEEVKAFLALDGVDDVEIIKDVTGTPLTPGHPKMCLGNGDFPGFECCCDECDYYLKCFAEEVDAMFAEDNLNATQKPSEAPESVATSRV